ncbi:hypothetical protein QR680_009907 [Steinernema hermaphroditum]|uniref:non-specific serine/threonine protein kinase n=1 Tax=Steinernema hermaphroditum TaxID=289476 RepID=A0AA39IM16_9BILA|nr:hypothetical protein QR680_009907 [Steinernema hermaphroditum]
MLSISRAFSILAVAFVARLSLGHQGEDMVCAEQPHKCDDSHGKKYVPFFSEPLFPALSNFSDALSFLFWLIILVSLCGGMALYIRGMLVKLHSVKNIIAAHEELQTVVDNARIMTRKNRQARIRALPQEEQKTYEAVKKKRDQFRKRIFNENWRFHVATDFAPGMVVNGYQVEKRLGEGSYGVVYLVSKDKKKYAMKTDKLCESFLYGLKSDIAVLSSIKTTGGARPFCELYDAGVFHDRKYIVMSALGLSIADYLTAKSPLSIGCGIGLAKQALQGLEQLHEAGFVHRDFKGENCMMGCKQDGLSDSENLAEMRKLYLIDFGTVSRYTCPLCARKTERQKAGLSCEKGVSIVGVREYERLMDKFEKEQNKPGSKEEKQAFFAKEIVKLEEDWRKIIDKDGNFVPEKDLAEEIAKKKEKATEMFKEFYIDKTTLNVPAVAKEFRDRERADIDSEGTSKYSLLFNAKGELNAKMAIQVVDYQKKEAEFEAEYEIRSKIKNAKRLLAMKQCRHIPLPWMAQSFLFRSPHTACFSAMSVSTSEKPYGRKDDIESWYYVMVDWISRLKLRACNDDDERGHIARLKLSSRYGDDAQRLATEEAPMNYLINILKYIDSLEYFEKPNYQYIYGILDEIMEKFKLSAFPLDWESSDWPEPEQSRPFAPPTTAETDTQQQNPQPKPKNDKKIAESEKAVGDQKVEKKIKNDLKHQKKQKESVSVSDKDEKMDHQNPQPKPKDEKKIAESEKAVGDQKVEKKNQEDLKHQKKKKEAAITKEKDDKMAKIVKRPESVSVKVSNKETPSSNRNVKK